MPKLKRSEIQKLESITGKLEAWQSRNNEFDPTGLAGAAKSKLITLLNELEKQLGKHADKGHEE